MRTAAGFDRRDPFGGERLVPHQELGVFLREDVVGDDRELVVLAQQAAESEEQRGLAAADRAADADGERPRRVVTRERRLTLLVEPRAIRVVG